LLSVLEFFETVADIDQDVNVGSLSAKVICRTITNHELFQRVTLEMCEMRYIFSGKAKVHIVLFLFPQNAFLQLQPLTYFGRAVRYDIQFDAHAVALALTLDHRLRFLFVDPTVHLSAFQAVHLIIAQATYRYSLQGNSPQIQQDRIVRSQERGSHRNGVCPITDRGEYHDIARLRRNPVIALFVRKLVFSLRLVIYVYGTQDFLAFFLTDLSIKE